MTHRGASTRQNLFVHANQITESGGLAILGEAVMAANLDNLAAERTTGRDGAGAAFLCPFKTFRL